MERCGGRWSGSVATDMSRIDMIAAMEREVRPLIRSWNVRTLEHGGRRYRLFENGQAVLICAGIGPEAARRATEAEIQEVHPVRVISVGFAGALAGSPPVGQVLEPPTVLNSAASVMTAAGPCTALLLSSSTPA